jgi:hypothetical protein
MQTRHGRCLCGQVRYAFDPQGVTDQSHCHCESCRRAVSAAMASFLTIRDSAWRWTGTQHPARFGSSPGVERLFCSTCGSPIAYRTATSPGETDFHAMTLDALDAYAPTAHTFWSEKLSWLHLNDDLPRHSGDQDTPSIAKTRPQG